MKTVVGLLVSLARLLIEIFIKERKKDDELAEASDHDTDAARRFFNGKRL